MQAELLALYTQALVSGQDDAGNDQSKVRPELSAEEKAALKACIGAGITRRNWYHAVDLWQDSLRMVRSSSVQQLWPMAIEVEQQDFQEIEKHNACRGREA